MQPYYRNLWSVFGAFRTPVFMREIYVGEDSIFLIKTESVQMLSSFERTKSTVLRWRVDVLPTNIIGKTESDRKKTAYGKF